MLFTKAHITFFDCESDDSSLSVVDFPHIIRGDIVCLLILIFAACLFDPHSRCTSCLRCMPSSRTMSIMRRNKREKVRAVGECVREIWQKKGREGESVRVREKVSPYLSFSVIAVAFLIFGVFIHVRYTFHST
jgi:hypothetical protein